MKVSLVGAGPGDPGLITVKGRQVISEADVIVYDALASPKLLEYAREDAELVYVGKVASNHAMPQAQINRLLLEKAKEGRHVARLKGGDPYIFGRGGEEGEYLLEHGIAYEEIPGISSAVAAPAYAGIPVTHRDYASSVIILTGHESEGKAKNIHNWDALAKSGATLVFVMGVKNLAEIAKNLIEAGMDSDTPAAIIYRGTTPFQRTLAATLASLPQKAKEQGFTNPSVIVIGKVVSLQDRLCWFAKRPLFGKTVAITRAREQASEMAHLLENLGACVLQCPSICIEPLDDYSLIDSAIDNLAKYSWVVFTSANGVKYFWERLDLKGKDSRAFAGAKVAAIGPGTAKALLRKGIAADLTPKNFVAEDLAIAIKNTGNLEKILIPRAMEARMVLPEELARAGAQVDVAPVYKTVPAASDAETVRDLLEKNSLDCICFASSSTVHNFFKFVNPDLVRAHSGTALASIGPVTAAALAEYGFVPSIQPKKYTISDMADAIKEYFLSGK